MGKILNSQLSNFKTFEKYKNELINLAENVFIYEGLPKYIDESFLNKILFERGVIAFFMDEELGLLALPFTNASVLDIYNRPTEIDVYGRNGYFKHLTRDEFVLMYDNNGHYSMYLGVLQNIERIANIKRVIDINISQQKTPRIWKTKTGTEKTLKDMLNSYEGNVEAIIGYDSLLLDNLESVIAPAPFVADKLEDSLKEEYAEFCRLIGIANIEIEKKERLISDEVKNSMGGTIASRYNRFAPRLKAIKEIKEKWGIDIKVAYYDNLPTSLEPLIKNESEEIKNVDISNNDNN